MDIEGAEYDAFTDILPHHEKITGIVLEIHFRSLDALHRAVELLSALDKNFLLIHVHGNNATGARFSTKKAVGKIPYLLELTYINKNLVSRFSLSKNQKHPCPIDMPNVPSRPDVTFEIKV